MMEKIIMFEWGGLIKTMYEQYSKEEIPPKIRNLKTRLSLVEKVTTIDELHRRLKSFSEEERNYLNSKLLDQLCNVSSTPIPLRTAARDGYFKAAFFLLMRLKYYDEQIKDAKNMAIKYGRFNIVKLLTNYRQLPIDNDLLKTVCSSPSKNAIKILQFFLENGGSMSHNYVHLFRTAFENGNIEIIKFIFLKYRNNACELMNILYFGLQFGIPKIIDREQIPELLIFLVKNDAKFTINWTVVLAQMNLFEIIVMVVKKQPELLDSALLNSISVNNECYVRKFIEMGASVIHEHIAYRSVSMEIIDILIEKAKQNNNLDILFMRFTSSHNKIEIIERILQAGANVQVTDNFAIKYACRHQYICRTELFLKYGAIPDDNCLFFISKSHCFHTVARLIFERGNFSDETIISALVHSIICKDIYGIKAIMENITHISEENTVKCLETAILYKDLEIVKILREMGMNIKAQNNAAIKYAATLEGNMYIIKYLYSFYTENKEEITRELLEISESHVSKGLKKFLCKKRFYASSKERATAREKGFPLTQKNENKF